MDVNFIGPITLTKAVLADMGKKGNSGCAVGVVSSVQGRLGIPERTSYAASKHALQVRCSFFRDRENELKRGMHNYYSILLICSFILWGSVLDLQLYCSSIISLDFTNIASPVTNILTDIYSQTYKHIYTT